ncbi:trichothecene efflux pump [Fusarium pseudoanthophilum]|uniref:Trichothecene efflux pump n=1 Tax=Fusarium pseudoanthophilum TaxID=48495 RepID=A0A8H5PMI6_9HYPO|nr:trichothecene efflux pump [Fusarium pseudoanthophilum]
MKSPSPKPLNNGTTVEQVEKAISRGPSYQEPEDGDFKMTWQLWLAMASFQLGYMSTLFSTSMTSTIMSEINADIGPSTSYTWMTYAQLFCTAVLCPSFGRLSDVYGRRNFLIVGNIIGAIGCVVAATSHEVRTVIIGSAFIGVGNAIQELALTCLSEMVPRRSRFLAMGIFHASAFPALVFGPVIAFRIVRDGSWRGTFWLTFALDLAACALTILFYKPVHQYQQAEGKTEFQRLLGLDWFGNFLFIAGITILGAGLLTGGKEFPWKSTTVITLMIVGGLLLVALLVWERYTKVKESFFPREFFTSIRGSAILIQAAGFFGMAYYSTSTLWPQQVAMLYTGDTMAVGWYTSAFGAAGCLAGPIVGYFITKFGHARWVLTGNLAVITTCLGAQAIVTPGSHVASTVIVALIGFCVTSITVAAIIMIQLDVPHNYIGTATGVAITCRSMGGAIGVVVYTSVLSSRFSSNLPSKAGMPLAMAGVDPKTIPGILQALLSGNLKNPALQGVPPEILAIALKGIKSAFASALRVTFLTSISFAAVALVLVAFSADVDHLMTRQVDVKLAGDEGSGIAANNSPLSEPHVT